MPDRFAACRLGPLEWPLHLRRCTCPSADAQLPPSRIRHPARRRLGCRPVRSALRSGHKRDLARVFPRWEGPCRLASAILAGGSVDGSSRRSPARSPRRRRRARPRRATRVLCVAVVLRADWPHGRHIYNLVHRRPGAARSMGHPRRQSWRLDARGSDPLSDHMGHPYWRIRRRSR